MEISTSDSKISSIARIGKETQDPCAVPSVAGSEKARKRRGRKPKSSEPMIDKKERNRICAKQCRERKNLRYKYLEEYVEEAEDKVLLLQQELESLNLWAAAFDEGIIAPELLAYRASVEKRQAKKPKKAKKVVISKNPVSATKNVAPGKRKSNRTPNVNGRPFKTVARGNVTPAIVLEEERRSEYLPTNKRDPQRIQVKAIASEATNATSTMKYENNSFLDSGSPSLTTEQQALTPEVILRVATVPDYHFNIKAGILDPEEPTLDLDFPWDSPIFSV